MSATSAHAGNATLRRKGRPGRALRLQAIGYVRCEPPGYGGRDRHAGAGPGPDDQKRGEHCDRQRGSGEGDRGQFPAVEEPAGGIAWRAIHRRRRRGFGDEGHRRSDIHEQLEHHDVHGVKWGGQSQCQWDGDDYDQCELGAEVESDRAPQLRGQTATALDRADDRRVCIVDEH